MKDNGDTRRYSLDRLSEMHKRGETHTRADAPARTVDAEFWTSARVMMPAPGKAAVSLRIDTDVLDWFRAQGKGHLSRMNAVLRSFMEAHKGEW